MATNLIGLVSARMLRKDTQRTAVCHGLFGPLLKNKHDPIDVLLGENDRSLVEHKDSHRTLVARLAK